MSQHEQKLPALALLLAILLMMNGILGLWALSQTLIGGTSVISIPSFADKNGSIIAYIAAGLSFVCFGIAGIALMFRRKPAIPFFVSGAIFYAGYFVAAILIFFARAAWQSIAAGVFSVGDALFLAVLFIGVGAISFFVTRLIYVYLQDLSQSEILQ